MVIDWTNSPVDSCFSITAGSLDLIASGCQPQPDTVRGMITHVTLI